MIQRAILRNPVLNPVTMATASDMATWMRVLAGCVPSRGVGDGDGDGDGVGDGVHNDDVNAIDAIYNGAELQCLQSLSWLPYADKVGERGWYDGGVDAAAVHSGRSRRARAESADLRAVSAPAAGSEQVGMSGEMEGRVLRNPEDDHYLRSGVTAEMTSELVMRFFVCGVCWRIQEGIVDAGVIC